MRLLFLAHLLPLPLDSGGKIKSFYTLRALAKEHEVHLLTYVRHDEENELAEELRAFCSSVRTVPLVRSGLRQTCDLTGSLLLGRSFIVSRDDRAEMRKAVEEAVSLVQPEVVHIDHLQMAQFVGKSPTYDIVLDQHNVESRIIRRIAETSGSWGMKGYARLEWPKLQKFEIESCRKADVILTVSDEDAATLRGLDARIGPVSAVPIGVDVEYFQPIPIRRESKNMLSIATMHWPPNIDSMLYFCSEILPIIRERVPDSTLTIAGQRPSQEILALERLPGVRVTGYVDDVRELAADCGTFIVPLRSGSGVRVKILNALAMGLPVVSTSVGSEGLQVENGRHAIIADTPLEFAEGVVKLLKNRELAAELGANGRSLVCEQYSWGAIGERLLDTYRRSISR